MPILIRWLSSSLFTLVPSWPRPPGLQIVCGPRVLSWQLGKCIRIRVRACSLDSGLSGPSLGDANPSGEFTSTVHGSESWFEVQRGACPSDCPPDCPPRDTRVYVLTWADYNKRVRKNKMRLLHWALWGLEELGGPGVSSVCRDPGTDIGTLCPQDLWLQHRHEQTRASAGHLQLDITKHACKWWDLPELFGNFHTATENGAIAKINL